MGVQRPFSVATSCGLDHCFQWSQLAHHKREIDIDARFDQLCRDQKAGSAVFQAFPDFCENGKPMSGTHAGGQMKYTIGRLLPQFCKQFARRSARVDDT
jgi:hypothetical protein